jgi:hypothetical protein
MAGLDPAIHALPVGALLIRVDARHKAGHDEVGVIEFPWIPL